MLVIACENICTHRKLFLHQESVTATTTLQTEGFNAFQYSNLNKATSEIKVPHCSPTPKQCSRKIILPSIVKNEVSRKQRVGQGTLYNLDTYKLKS